MVTTVAVSSTTITMAIVASIPITITVVSVWMFVHIWLFSCLFVVCLLWPYIGSLVEGYIGRLYSAL